MNARLFHLLRLQTPAAVMCLLLAGLLLCQPEVAHARAVVVVPHPDDETLGLAGAIRERVVKDEEVWVVLGTRGEATGVRALLNGSTTCSLCARVHNPVEEGFLAEDLSGGLITPAGIGNGRVREFHASMETLGVPAERRVVYDLGDGNLTSLEATALFTILATQFGTDTDYLTVQGTVDTTHKDHIALADALAASTQIPESRKFFYAVYEFNKATHSGMPVQQSIEPYMAKKQEALNCYKLYDAQSGRYGIGNHSVSTMIRNAGLYPYEFPRSMSSGVRDWQLY